MMHKTFTLTIGLEVKADSYEELLTVFDRPIKELMEGQAVVIGGRKGHLLKRFERGTPASLPPPVLQATERLRYGDAMKLEAWGQEVVRQILVEEGWKIARAAVRLGVSFHALSKRLARWGLKRPPNPRSS